MIYYIVNGRGLLLVELHKLIHDIKYLELSLEIFLEVVHVPRTHMIDQHMDGLSQGVPDILQLFRGVTMLPCLLQWVANMSGHL